MMITTSISAKLRILWSVLLSLVLSSSAFAEVFFLNTDNKESSELNFLDEESKAESEKSEENNNRKHNENSFEFSGAEGESNALFTGFDYLDYYAVYSRCNCSYFYYPHVNPAELSIFQPKDYIGTSLFVLYHKLVFYDLIINLH